MPPPCQTAPLRLFCLSAHWASASLWDIMAHTGCGEASLVPHPLHTGSPGGSNALPSLREADAGAHTYFRNLLMQAPGLGLCPPSSGPPLSGRCSLWPGVGHRIKRSSHQFFGIFLQTGPCLAQVGPEVLIKSPPPPSAEPWWCSSPSLAAQGLF